MLHQNPRLTDAWESLAQSLDKLGQLSESLAAYQQALTLSGGAAHIAVAAGHVLVEMKRYDEAQSHAELARRETPALADSLLAEIALVRHQPEAAAAAARAAMSAGAGAINVGPLIALAQARASAGKLAEGLALLDQAGQELARRAPGQTYPDLSYVRGDILARLGRNAEAEQAFRREMKDNPAEMRASSGLALLYASEGRSEEALSTLQQLVTTQRSPAAYVAAVRTLRVLGDPTDGAALLREGLGLFPQSPELQSLSRSH